MKKTLARLLTALMVTAVIAPDLAPLTVLAAENEVVEVGSEAYSEEAAETPETASEDGAVSETETSEEGEASETATEAATEEQEKEEKEEEDSESVSETETSETEEVAETSEEASEDAPVVDMATPMVLVSSVEELDAAMKSGENVGVSISEEFFPDEEFRRYITENFDANGDGALDIAEIFAAQQINIDISYDYFCYYVSDFSGIEFLRNLKYFTCENTEIEKIDFSKNASLIDIQLRKNNLSSIDVSKNENLKVLTCEDNCLEKIDVSKNKELRSLNVSENHLTKIDVSKNKKITLLDVSWNKFSSLNVNNIKTLLNLRCANNQIKTLNVSGLTKLTELYCGGNPISKLDLSKNKELRYLDVSNTTLSKLDLKNVKNLTELNISNTNIASVDSEVLEGIFQLRIDGTSIKSIDLSKSTNLTLLSCVGSNLLSLDLTNCANLVSISANNSSILALKLPENIQFRHDDFFNASGNAYEVALNGNGAVALADLPAVVEADRIVGTTNCELVDGVLVPDETGIAEGAIGYTYRASANYTHEVELKLEERTVRVEFSEFDICTWTGSEIEVKTDVYYGNVKLKEGRDYTLSYRNNVELGNAADENAPTVVVTGKGDFEFTLEKTFNIVKFSNGEHYKAFSVKDVEVLYDGSEKKLVPQVVYHGKVLAEDEFTYEYPDTREGAYTEPGVYKVIVRGADKHILKSVVEEATITIKGNLSLAKAKVTTDKKSYPFNTATGITKPGSVVVKLGKETLVEGVDYVLTYENNSKAGTAYVVANGIGKYTGTVKCKYTITGIKLKSDMFRIYHMTHEYRGYAYGLAPNLDYTTGLMEGIDFVIIYPNGSNIAGTGNIKVTFKGVGNYTGSVVKTVKVTKAPLASIGFAAGEDGVATYSKTGAKVDVVVKDKTGAPLKEGRDYKLVYKNNKKVASKDDRKAPYVYAVGLGNYKGQTAVLKFDIAKADLSEVASASADRLKWANKFGNFKAKNLKVVETATGKKLSSSDYKILKYSYVLGEDFIQDLPEEAMKRGVAPIQLTIRVTVEGRGNYTGEAYTDYTFYEKDMKKVQIKAIEDQVYTGLTIKPEVVVVEQVKNGKATEEVVLEEGVDYVVSYGDNTRSGEGTVVVEGIGLYKGSKTAKFKILPRKFN